MEQQTVPRLEATAKWTCGARPSNFAPLMLELEAACFRTRPSASPMENAAQGMEEMNTTEPRRTGRPKCSSMRIGEPFRQRPEFESQNLRSPGRRAVVNSRKLEILRREQARTPAGRPAPSPRATIQNGMIRWWVARPVARNVEIAAPMAEK